MDPNANLDEQLMLSKQINEILDACKHDGFFNSDQRADLISKGLRLTELIETLDHWLTGGGFVPARWTVNNGRVPCSRCGKSVSTAVPKETIVRAWVECHECVAKDRLPTLQPTRLDIGL